MTAEPQSIQSTALALAALGYAVLPLTPPDPSRFDLDRAGKKPLLTEWTTRDALTEQEILKAWSRYPDANVGFVCGSKSGIICLDIDPRNGGLDWWYEHEASIKATQAPCEFSGRGDGGMHWFFRIPSEHEGRVVSSKIAPGIDFLGDGKQVVTSPSIHAATGKPYYFAPGLTLFDRELIPDLPDFLAVYLSSRIENKPAVISAERLKNRECTPADRERLEAQLMTLDGSTGRHHTIGSWVINAVATGLEHGEIIVMAEEWTRSQGREPQANEIQNWINSAIVGLQSGQFQPSMGNAGDWGFEVVAEEAAASGTPHDIIPPGVEEASLAAQHASVWVDTLDRTEKGALRPTRRNGEIILEKDTAMTRIFGVNEMAQSIVTLRAPPWEPDKQIPPDGSPLTDVDVLNFSSYMATKYGIEIGKDKAIDAITVVANRYRFHPVQEYLNSLTWDGFPRLDDMLQTYFRAEGDPEYLAFVGSKWMISCVARAMNPGCKADHALILEGEQGILKSTAFKVLGGRWFSDDMGGDIGSKDAIDCLRFSWIIEMPELSRLNRAAVDLYTAFLSRQIDRVRPAYGRCTMEIHRGYIFCGSTNQETYLRDETGNRRFWPVSCKHLNPVLNEYILISDLQEDRDQLWAEAVVRFKRGERWYPEGSDKQILLKLRNEQAQRYQADQWRELIRKYLDGWDEFGNKKGSPRTHTTGIMVWTECLKGAPISFDRMSQLRVASVIRSLGWKASTFSYQGERMTGYSRPKDHNPEVNLSVVM